MRTTSITLIAVFSAIAIVLNPLKIPAPLLPGFNHRIFEVPVVIAFLLLGFKLGSIVGILHVIGQMIFFTGPIAGLGYPMGFIALLNMMLGIYVAKTLVKRRLFRNRISSENKMIVFFTLFGALFRGLISPILDYFILFNFLTPLALGQKLPPEIVLSLVPSNILFNIVVPLYTIPISYFIAKKLKKSLNIFSAYEKNSRFMI